jgi:hypothetical protein
VKAFGGERMKKTLIISEELYNQISDIATDYKERIDEMAEQLLNAQVTLYRQEKATMFYPGRHFGIDPALFVEAKLLESDLARLKVWLHAKDPLQLLSCGKNDLMIIKENAIASE